MSLDSGQDGPASLEWPERGDPLLHSLLALSPDAALIVDTRGIIREANDLALALFGYSAAELEGSPIETLLPERSRNVHERQRSAYLASPHARPMGVGLDLRGRCKDGSEIPVDVSLAPLSGEGTSGFVVAAVRDITALRRGEQLAARLAAIVRSSDVAIISTDADGLIDSWNPAAERLLGYAEQDVAGVPFASLVPEELAEEVAANHERARSGELVDLFDTVLVRKDGSKVQVAATLSVMRDTRGQLVGFSAMLRDMTERRRTQAQLAAVQADREVLADRERIARDLHDFVIQRIFTAGIGLEGVATAVSQPELARRLQLITEELDAAVREIRSSIFTLRRRPGTAGSLRGEVLDIAAHNSEALGFTPRVTVDGPLDSVVPDAVAEALLAVLREGLSNVARHAQASAAEVSVHADAGRVTLAITDNGRGMAGVTRRSGLRNLLHRAVELGGDMTVSTRAEGGTRLEWMAPLRAVIDG